MSESTREKAAWGIWSGAVSAKTIQALAKYGTAKCLSAYKLNVDEGEGPHMISTELNIHFNSVSPAINAGEEVNSYLRSIRY
jgi:hypothetical protein|tara:strand:+ start:986 stop:1231 length:246 start_codon:yes stop_codon:yes gene_type:complete